MAVEIDGAVVCVTGAGRGIGEATAKAFAMKGASVFVGDIDFDQAQRVAEEIGTSATAVKLDVADINSFVHFVETAKKHRQIDIMVNNAGIQRTGTFANQLLEAQLRELAINLGGVVTGMRLVLPDMLKRNHGHIVNISSMAGKMTVPGAAVYTASKFGVASLSRTVRAEIAHTNVTLTTVFPSAVQTELTAGLNISGVPRSTPEKVARVIVASCRHGHAEVTIPRWLAPIGAIEQAVPQRIGDYIKRFVGAQKRITEDNEATRAYQERSSKS